MCFVNLSPQFQLPLELLVKQLAAQDSVLEKMLVSIVDKLIYL